MHPHVAAVASGSSSSRGSNSRCGSCRSCSSIVVVVAVVIVKVRVVVPVAIVVMVWAKRHASSAWVRLGELTARLAIRLTALGVGTVFEN